MVFFSQLVVYASNVMENFFKILKSKRIIDEKYKAMEESLLYKLFEILIFF